MMRSKSMVMERTLLNSIYVIQKTTTMSIKRVLTVGRWLIMQKRRKKKRGSKHLEKPIIQIQRKKNLATNKATNKDVEIITLSFVCSMIFCTLFTFRNIYYLVINFLHQSRKKMTVLFFISQ